MKKTKKLLILSIVVFYFSLISDTTFAAKNHKGKTVNVNGVEVSYDSNAINGGVSPIPTGNDPKFADRLVEKEKYLSVPFETHINNYYSAPAAISMILNSLGITTYSQQQIAQKLGTLSNGTYTGYQIEHTLNSIVNGSKYKFNWVWYSNVNDFNSVKDNIISAVEYGNPVIINTEENLGDVFFRGHNTRLSFYNYGIIYAYFNYGNDFMYLDPGYDRFLGFVKFQKTQIKDLNYAMENRGYAW